jgi:polyisoprenoid-binding protein YceI
VTRPRGFGIVLILSSAGLFGQRRQLDPQLKYNVIKPESRVEFFVHSTFADIDGVFSSYQVEFKVPTPRFEDISFTMNVAAPSVHTGSGTKDKMVKGKHFFWAEKYPFITFVSKGIVPDPSNPLKFCMEGDFTIRGVTKPVTLQLTLGPQGNQHGHLYADLSFDRREFGMTYNMPFNRISDSVRVRFDLDVQGTVGDPEPSSLGSLLGSATPR